MNIPRALHRTRRPILLLLNSLSGKVGWARGRWTEHSIRISNNIAHSSEVSTEMLQAEVSTSAFGIGLVGC